jgi:ABC-type Mn2+/Zn2+ transport system ATPase subunit
VSPDATNVEGRIVAADLTKVFGQVKAVDGLSFSVEPGSVTGFLGPNGAGKTTTLRIILGLAAPTSGSGTISGVTHMRTCRPRAGRSAQSWRRPAFTPAVPRAITSGCSAPPRDCLTSAPMRSWNS